MLLNVVVDYGYSACWCCRLWLALLPDEVEGVCDGAFFDEYTSRDLKAMAMVIQAMMQPWTDRYGDGHSDVE